MNSPAPAVAEAPKFAVLVHTVESIIQHPQVENLTVVRLVGHPEPLIANKEDGKFRYEAGVSLVQLIPVGAILKRWLMEDLHAWDYAKGKGTLGGNRKDRVTARKFPSLDGGEERFESAGMMRPVDFVIRDGKRVDYITGEGGTELEVKHGDDVTTFLGVTQHGAPPPTVTV
jgi:hypothetical protein